MKQILPSDLERDRLRNILLNAKNYIFADEAMVEAFSIFDIRSEPDSYEYIMGDSRLPEFLDKGYIHLAFAKTETK